MIRAMKLSHPIECSLCDGLIEGDVFIPMDTAIDGPVHGDCWADWMNGGYKE
jgi:hypothetical protein